MISSDHSTGLPLVAPVVLTDLGEQLGSPSIAQAFASDFIVAWEERYACLECAIDSRDPEESLDAVVSLKTASIMVGAMRLARISCELEDLIRHSKFEAAASVLDVVLSCGTGTIYELRSLLSPEAGSAAGYSDREGARR